MARLLLRGGRVVDPAGGLDAEVDILIEDGRIAALEPRLEVEAPIYDAAGKVVAPGFIDLRARLREPGLEHAETIESGSRAAAAGGFTALCCLPDTQPVNDSPTVTNFIVERARSRAVVRVLPIGAATQGVAGEQLAEVGAMKEAGAVAIGDGDRSVMNSALLRRILRYAASFEMTVFEHCEDLHLSDTGDIHEGALSVRLGLHGLPSTAETVMAARNVLLCAETGARLHLAHLSARGAVEAVRRAKAEGAPLTAEVAAFHLALTVGDVPPYDGNYKIKPPLREAADREALLQGLADGALDAVVSDHAPHTGNVKMQEFETCPFGATGLETAVAVALEQLVHSGRTSLNRLIELFTVGPARALGWPPPRVVADAPAHLTLLDLERVWTFRAESSLSKSSNSPFLGREFRGGPVATIVDGRLVWEAADGLH